MNRNEIFELNKNAQEWEGKDYAEILAKLNMYPKDKSVHLIIEALNAATKLIERMEGVLEVAMGDIVYLTNDRPDAIRFGDTIALIEDILNAQEQKQ